MPRYGIAPQLSSHWFPDGSAHESPDVCRRGCCWSPYGHSSAAVGCHCHETEAERGTVSAGSVPNGTGEGLGGENKKTPVRGAQQTREEI